MKDPERRYNIERPLNDLTNVLHRPIDITAESGLSKFAIPDQLSGRFRRYQSLDVSAGGIIVQLGKTLPDGAGLSCEAGLLRTTLSDVFG